MFNSPFSFEGRIRRMEYGISFILCVVSYLIQLALLAASDATGAMGIVVLPTLIVVLSPIVWVMCAQGAKRCHDIGGSGWRQLIPFYVLVLLLQDGDPEINEYGFNPKAPLQDDDVAASETPHDI